MPYVFLYVSSSEVYIVLFRVWSKFFLLEPGCLHMHGLVKQSAYTIGSSRVAAAANTSKQVSTNIPYYGGWP